MHSTRPAFISYTHQNSAFVRRLAADLVRHGVHVWFDEDIEHGEKWVLRVEEALRECDELLVVLSPAAVRSPHVRNELAFAIEESKRVIPLLLTPCDRPIEIRTVKYIDFTMDYNAGFVETLRALAPNGNTSTARNTLSILIPVFNESAALKKFLSRLSAEGLMSRYQILLYDDGSTDDSFMVMQECSRNMSNVVCMGSRVNGRKIIALRNMLDAVRTPFVLPLDVDCVPIESEPGALERLMNKMDSEDYSATYFRIIPAFDNWLCGLQRLDYTIFTDAVRRLLNIPICLVGQGVLWKRDRLSYVLDHHSGVFDGDDLENTVIALATGMKVYWDRASVIIESVAKRHVTGLLRQRALSWEFGLWRVLLGSRAIALDGEAGAFYRNVVLIDFIAHPLKLLALPLLFSTALYALLGGGMVEGALFDMYWRSVRFSLTYGYEAIVAIWVPVVVNSLVSVRFRAFPALRECLFGTVYLTSPFVFLLYGKLRYASGISLTALVGASVFTIGVGLVLTYVWWAIIAQFLLWRSSLAMKERIRLIVTACIAPAYYFVLLVLCRTIGFIKYLAHRALR